MFLDFMSLILSGVGLFGKSVYSNAKEQAIRGDFDQKLENVKKSTKDHMFNAEHNAKIYNFLEDAGNISIIKEAYKDDFIYIYGENWEAEVEYRIKRNVYGSDFHWIYELVCASYNKFTFLYFGEGSDEEIRRRMRFVTRFQRYFDMHGEGERIVVCGLSLEHLNAAKYRKELMKSCELTLESTAFGQYVHIWW